MSLQELYCRSFFEVARVINSSLEPTEVLNRIAEQVTSAMGAKGCSIRLLDRDGKRLKISAAYGLSKDYLRKGSVGLDKSALDREALQGKRVYVANACSDPRFQYPDAAKAEGIVSLLVVPLEVEGRPIGVLRVYSGEPREFDEVETGFVSAIADMSAVAIENARMHQALKKDYELLTAYEYRIFED